MQEGDSTRGARVLGLDNIALDLPVANIGSRALAALLDYLLISLLLAGGGLLLVLLTAARLSGGWALALFAAYAFLLEWGYFALLEISLRGGTPGKLALGIRVVARDGAAAPAAALLLRNLLRLPDLFVGVFLIVFDPLGRRFGDRIAGTLVVHERRGEGGPLLGRVPERWSGREIAVAETYLGRAADLDPMPRQELAARLLRLVARSEPQWVEEARAAGSADEETLLRRALRVGEPA